MKAFILLAVFLVALVSATGEWNPVDPSEATSDALIQDIFNFGLDLVLHEANEEGLILDTDLTVTSIDSVETQVVNGINYRFVASLANERGAVAEVTYIVTYFPTTGVKTLSNTERSISYEAPY